MLAICRHSFLISLLTFSKTEKQNILVALMAEVQFTQVLDIITKMSPGPKLMRITALDSLEDAPKTQYRLVISEDKETLMKGGYCYRTKIGDPRFRLKILDNCHFKQNI